MIIPLNHVIFSVDERAAYQTDSGIFLRADLGMAYDYIVQWGIVHAAPENSGLKKGDKIWFHHLLKDDHMSNIQQEEFNLELEEVENKAYVCPKISKSGVKWDERILAVETDGKLKAYGQNTIGRIKKKEKTSELEVLDREEKHLVDVIDSGVGYSGTIIIREDTDYPIEIKGEDICFIRPQHIVGTYEDKTPKPKEGFTLIEPIDEGGWVNNGIIWVAQKRTVPRGLGKVISTTSEDLEVGDEVFYLKVGFSRIKLENHDVFYAISNEKILGKLCQKTTQEKS